MRLVLRKRTLKDRILNWFQCLGAESPEEWAQELAERKDFATLAAINNSTDYSARAKVQDKRRIANRILRQAGAGAVDAILAEIAKDGVGSPNLAELLVQIGDPRAVPVLKRKLDRGDFRAYVSLEPGIRRFVEKHKELQGPVEDVACRLCGKSKPVVEMRGFKDVFFCKHPCWGKRGMVLAKDCGKDCPYWVEGMCGITEYAQICTLQSGHYATACHLYRMHHGAS